MSIVFTQLEVSISGLDLKTQADLTIMNKAILEAVRAATMPYIDRQRPILAGDVEVELTLSAGTLED